MLGQHEGHDLAVKCAVVQTHDAIDSHGDESPGSDLENRRSEGATGIPEHVLARESDRKLHLLIVRGVGSLPLDNFLDPGRILNP
jgi:hypothetical protein